MVRISNGNSRRAAQQRSWAVPLVVVAALFAIAAMTVWYREKDMNAVVNDLVLLASSEGSSNLLRATAINNNSSSSATSSLSSSASVPTAPPFNSEANSQAMKHWRKNLDVACDNAKTAQQVLDIGKINKQTGFQMPSNDIPPQPRDDTAMQPCRFVVMDFGANIGDTSSHVIDSGLPQCDKKNQLKASTPLTHFNIETKQFEDIARRNPLTNHLIRMMANRSSGPEDYCYYGIEGNPVFTKRLQALEDFVMALRPRPIAHMHFLTESVGAGQDGPTQLYLDTINGEKNFWGSSLFADHQDIRKSADHDKETGGKGDKVTAQVMGYTIGTLMRKTLKAFQPDATPHDKSNNHLVLKVDIEGGEYPLLAQEHKDGTLCEFVKMGHNNTADLFIEFHSQRVTGRNPLAGRANQQVVESLTACGVQFRNLRAWWA